MGTVIKITHMRLILQLHYITVLHLGCITYQLDSLVLLLVLVASVSSLGKLVTLLYLSTGFSSGQERRGRRRNGIQRKKLELGR